ncbi:MAG: M48 family metallopeptidase [Candidatus Omnitrophica bacterium]|nr:M48 family metallopeptidase [Candidatus Omnitrophota bacterium]
MMWELIQANQRKSVLLLVLLGLVLAGLGCVIGLAWLGPEGAVYGLGAAALIWVVLTSLGFLAGDQILLSSSAAEEVSKELYPQLFNVVEEMKIASNLAHMPRVYVMDDPGMNAFATGIKPERCAVAVTAGLVSRLNRDELQGVIAHEMSHITNRDVYYMTLAGIVLGSIRLLSHVFLRGMWFGGGSRRRYRTAGRAGVGGQAQVVILAAALVFAILGPILAQIFYFSLSRKREYLADACAVRLTRYPEGLASALEKISQDGSFSSVLNPITSPMYIFEPRAASSLTHTHPPILDRIRILRAIAQGAGFASYQKAYASFYRGRDSSLLPPSAFSQKAEVPLRAPSPASEEPRGRKAQARDLMDVMRSINDFAFLVCACGMKIKIPPRFNHSTITCPKCSRVLDVPLTQLAAAAAILAGRGVSAGKKAPSGARGDEAPQIHRRRGTGWESFACRCGQTLTLSPAFIAPQMICRRCGRLVRIESYVAA